LKRLRKLAALLLMHPETFDLRSNKAGVAVSGEITLHGEQIYIQVSQSIGGAAAGILIRQCDGRKDYTGYRNHFAPLNLLDDLPALARRVESILRAPKGNRY